MNAETIARALGCASKSNSGWSCKCPAHNDGTASLSLGEKDGRLLWHCHAGCSQAAVTDALKAKGLLPERAKRERKAKGKLGPIVAAYDYVDAAGELILQVTRHNPKDFRQRRPDPDKPGEWIWNLDGINARPLYRLPELLAADPAADVFLVEGEKDADRLRSLGLTATTTAQGAKGWPKSDHSPLAGRHVVLLPDNDDAGRAYAAQAGRDLMGKVASLRLLELPGVPAKGDASDWLDAGGTAKDLGHMAAQAVPYEQPPAEEEPPPEPETEPVDDHPDYEGWNRQLHRTDRGEARDVIHNATIILRVDGRFQGNVRYNLFLETVEARGLPWRGGGWLPWSDADDLQLAAWCQQRHAYLRPKTVADAVQVVARDVQHHPVRERLNALTWDGTPRLEKWLTVYMGVEDTPYARAVAKAWPVSAAARVFRPGCKADHVLIFEGAQGIGKSTAASALAMEDAWFADEIADLGSKDAGQDLCGKWVIELGELSALNRGAVERVKAFLSRRIDHYRPSYGRRSQDFPRQCVFLGSTNADAYLGDETGGRRFWPVKCGVVDIAALQRDRDQLWAEAVVAYRSGATWWLDRDIEAEARDEQDARRVADPWEHRVLEYVAGRPEVTVAELLDTAIAMPADRQGQPDQNRIARILRANKWERVRARRNGSLTWLYRPARAAAVSESGNIAHTGNTSGNGKASVSAPVPSVPTVPSNFLAHRVRTHTHAHTRAEVSAAGGTSGNSGNTPHAWGDLDHWRMRISRAGMDRDAKVAVVSDWCRAAGGTVTATGLSLPELPHSYPAAELKRTARDLGLMPKVVFTARAP